MRITIEDLEALKELSDEMEENHLETEKAMQEDLGTIISNKITSLSVDVVVQITRTRK